MYYKFEENTNLRRQNYRSDFSLNLLTGKFIHLSWTSTIVSRCLEASWKNLDCASFIHPEETRINGYKYDEIVQDLPICLKSKDRIFFSSRIKWLPKEIFLMMG